MAIGNQINLSTSQLNTEIAEVAVDFHNAARHAIDFFERINSLGVSGLENVGFTPTDAQSFFNVANEMNTAALVWFGTVGTPIVDFDNATAAVR